jgi:putative transcriptional regulator
MAINIKLDEMLARRKKRSKELAEFVGITEQNISLIKTVLTRWKRCASFSSANQAICSSLNQSLNKRLFRGLIKDLIRNRNRNNLYIWPVSH